MIEIDVNPKKKFSYSAMNLFLSCQYKYYLHYILKAPKDIDAQDDGIALRFGKAVHKMLEISEHQKEKFHYQDFVRVCTEHLLTHELCCQVYATVFSGYRMHEASKLKAIGYEIEIGNEEIIGYVDLVLQDMNGWWWICDIKTSGMIIKQLFARLHNDPQLNLYSSFAEQIAEKLNLDMKFFAGCRYRVLEKPRAVVRPNEAWHDYTARVKPDAYDVEIPVKALNYADALEKILRIKLAAGELTGNSAEKNMQKCIDYNRPCEYWSYCYGATFTECANGVTVFNLQDMCDRTLPRPDIIDDLM